MAKKHMKSWSAPVVSRKRVLNSQGDSAEHAEVESLRRASRAQRSRQQNVEQHGHLGSRSGSSFPGEHSCVGGAKRCGPRSLPRERKACVCTKIWLGVFTVLLFVTITPHPQLGTAQASVRRWADRAAAPPHCAVRPAGGEVNPLAGQPQGHLDVVTVGGRRQAGRSTFRMTPCAHNARKGLWACGARPGGCLEPFGATGGQAHHLYPGGRAAAYRRGPRPVQLAVPQPQVRETLFKERGCIWLKHAGSAALCATFSWGSTF